MLPHAVGLFIFSFFVATYGWSAPAIAKKNLCSITLNSSEELNIFKSHLSEKDWNFIELVPDDSQADDKNWFAGVCKPTINCDILVISGHFGGSFFGRSKFRLSVEDLEARSCDAKCDGILNKPKEVFLFGCNTLASKEKDLRSPEEYMQVLINDGFSYAQASQIVSFRYSGFGNTFQSKMSQIFAKTPRIYGFSSIGPSGKTVTPFLENYLTSARQDYQKFDQYWQSSKNQKNQKFLTAMKATSVAQSQGSLLNMKSTDEKPYCYIRSDKKTRLEKLNFIQNLFSTGKALDILSHVQEFLHELKNSSIKLTTPEADLFNAMKSNSQLKQQLLDLMQLKGDLYIPLKVNVLFTLKELELVDSAYVANAYNGMIDLQTPFTPSRRDMLCSAAFTTEIPLELIPEQRWQEVDFLISVMCLKPSGLLFQTKMAKVIAEASNSAARTMAAVYFCSAKPQSLSVQTMLANALLSEKSRDVRSTLIMMFAQIESTYPGIKFLLQQAFQKETDPYVRQQLKDLLAKKMSN